MKQAKHISKKGIPLFHWYDMTASFYYHVFVVTVCAVFLSLILPVDEGLAAPTASKAKWDDIVLAAQKEGVVNLYAGWGPNTRTMLGEGFMKKYGISLNLTPFARESDMFAKLSTERVANLRVADVLGGGPSTLMLILKPAGFLGKIEPMIMMPDIMDKKTWRGGQGLPFADQDRTTVGMLAVVLRNVIYNVTQVRKEQLTSYKDILKPEFKGKIVLDDPTTSGSGNAFMAHLAYNLWNVEESLSYLKRLVELGVVIERDKRILVESVARGKYAIGLGPYREMITQFIDNGAPIAVPTLAEALSAGPSAGGIGVVSEPAHPNATIVFINWLLSREGQSLLAQAFLCASMRIDASTEGINPMFIPQPGQKLYWDTEEMIRGKGVMMKLTKEILDKNPGR